MIALLYLASIPVSHFSYCRLRRAADERGLSLLKES
jgi:hypothetical protein